MDPTSAGILVGGSLLSNFLMGQQSSEEERKKMAVQAEQKYGQDQQQALGDVLNYYRQALR